MIGEEERMNYLVGVRIADKEGLQGVGKEEPAVPPFVRTRLQYFHHLLGRSHHLLCHSRRRSLSLSLPPFCPALVLISLPQFPAAASPRRPSIDSWWDMCIFVIQMTPSFNFVAVHFTSDPTVDKIPRHG